MCIRGPASEPNDWAKEAPGRLANTIAGTSRNAWRDLWIKRSGHTEWRLADDCRTAGVQGCQ